MVQKNLHILLQNIPVISITGTSEIVIEGIQTDSRAVAKNMLFVAQNGVSGNGHDFIDDAIQKGASAIVCEKLPQHLHETCCYILVENSQKTSGDLLARFYAIDFSTFSVVGITGTNGKTTTVTLLYKLFSQLGYTCGLISTVRNIIGVEEIEATHTTPNAVQLFELFGRMIDAGCSYCFMEVSSHAIDQQRIAGIMFRGAVFSNLTQDHLDYHKTFAEYIRAKKSFFDALPESAFALTNNDDKNGMIMLQNSHACKYTYSLKSYSDFKTKVLETHSDGMLLSVEKSEVWTNFLGVFNAYNILAVYATAIILGESHDAILQILSTIKPADGRMEFFKSAEGKTAIVDYAHTPDALENILRTLRKQCSDSMRLITVVGAGGNRDKTKRPIMGNIAATLSDMLIVTADNPRYENPQDIANDMIAGIGSEYTDKVLCILQREEAIKTALMLAKKSDLVVVAGKGHETYQEIQGVKHHFVDREVIKKIFNL